MVEEKFSDANIRKCVCVCVCVCEHVSSAFRSGWGGPGGGVLQLGNWEEGVECVGQWTADRAVTTGDM